MKGEQGREHARCAGWNFPFKSPCLHLSGAVARKLGNHMLNGSENNNGYAVTLGLRAGPVPIFLLHDIESSQKKDYLICLLSFKLSHFPPPNTT
jgi:hypothetical protein